MATKKYYAVKIGKNPGIYNTWPECQVQVNGYSGAIFKSFPTKEMAEDFIAGRESEITTNNEQLISSSDGIIAYVDGSYNDEQDMVGYGVYLVYNNQTEVMYGHFKQRNGGRNVEGEVAGSLAAIRYAFEHNMPITLFYDYQGIECWATGAWKRNKSYTIKYHDEIKDLLSKGLKLKFGHTKSHTGIIGNEYVDRLAKYACNVYLSDSDIRLLLEISDSKGFPSEIDY